MSPRVPDVLVRADLAKLPGFTVAERLQQQYSHSRIIGRLPLAVFSLGTFTKASPSSTTSPPTAQTQASRARDFAGMSSFTVTVTTTVSPIFTGARKFSVCEM